MTTRWMLTVLGFAAAGFAQAKEPVGKTVARPNILFCIADDWGWPHAGAYGDQVVKTPTFDRLAAEGALFDYAYVASPSCTPSRNAVLTGQYHWRLGAGANLWSWLDVKHPVYPLLLQQAGYHVGHWRKSWGPGRLNKGGYTKTHPAGKEYGHGFRQFLDARPEGAPFCFWLGSADPHRPYVLGSGKKSGIEVDKIKPPGFYPNVEQVRSDIADYYFEVQRFDSDVAAAIGMLEEIGELENTIVVMTGDHGMPFPRCKTNIYDMGVRVPLAIRCGKQVGVGGRPAGKPGRRLPEFVSLVDLAPTFLEMAGVEAPEVMTGRSLWPLLLASSTDQDPPDRAHVIYGMERHTAMRPGGVGYPCRGIRTAEWAYIRNYKPDRWPAGNPPIYGDCDPHNSRGKSITKSWILDHQDTPAGRKFYDWCFAKRPAEELYDMVRDPDQLHNLAADSRHAAQKAKLSAALDAELLATGDPRATGGGDAFEKFPYYGGGVWKGSGN